MTVLLSESAYPNHLVNKNIKCTMKNLIKFFVSLLLLASCTTKSPTLSELPKSETDPLPSWNEGTSKSVIIDFVTKTTTSGNSDFTPEADRIAVFDNDGTLWAEQPMYFQLAYAIDFIKKESENHPEWKKKEPFKSLLEDDIKHVMEGGEKALFEIMMVSHAGMTSDEFQKSVSDWLNSATHPKTGKPYNQMIYQPMVELLEYLRANGYKTFIVSGGGIDFMRVWAENAYAIPPYQVIGSSIKSKYEIVDGMPVITKLPELNFIDDKAGKPVGIYQHIGKRPILAVGNSDGDYEMLQYVTTGEGARLGMFIHHTDSIREFAYDRDSHIGKLLKGLDDAPQNNWLIVDMKSDWNKIFNFK